MGSSRSEYYRHEVTWQDLKGTAEKMAWKKSGFEDRETLKNHVRSLPPEERLDLLTELFLEDISKIYLGRRQEFMENLGQSISVTKEEILEYAARVYPSFGVDSAWIDNHYHISAKDFNLVSCRRKK